MEVDDVCILACLSNDLIIPTDGKQLYHFSDCKTDTFVYVSGVLVSLACSLNDTVKHLCCGCGCCQLLLSGRLEFQPTHQWKVQKKTLIKMLAEEISSSDIFTPFECLHLGGEKTSGLFEQVLFDLHFSCLLSCHAGATCFSICWAAATLASCTTD